ncbi:MAG: Hsp20/alpha crystallin family protein [Planctomycetota bacterium]|jgi:HSP20 family protein
MFALTRTNRRNGLFPFENFFEDFWAAPAARAWAPALDFAETADAYVVHVEVPGVDPQEVEISIEDGRLEITGEKSVEREDEKQGWFRLERRHGSFHRVVELPGAIDTDQVKAESRNGVLTITLPKREEAKAKKIDVTVS